MALLRWQARLLLRRHRPLVVGITGTVGKTSAKEMARAVLSRRLVTRASSESDNAEMSLLLTILGDRPRRDEAALWPSWAGRARLVGRGLRLVGKGAALAAVGGGYPQALVLEIGISRPGAMASSVRLADLDVAVITALGEVPVHVAGFASPEAQRAEKLQLLQGLRPQGTFVYNADDRHLRAAAAATPHRQIAYGLSSPDAQPRGVDYSVIMDASPTHALPTGIAFVVAYGGSRVRLRLDGVLGRSHAYAALAASAVGIAAGVPLEAVPAALAELRPASGRMQLRRTGQQAMVIDDTYNSSPLAARAALRELGDLRVRRRVAVLGDMLELGPFSEEEHAAVGTLAAATSDHLLCVGLHAPVVAAAAVASGLPRSSVEVFPEAGPAAGRARDLVGEGDVVLVKGSRALRMERVVEALLSGTRSGPSSPAV
ncbi:MAG TPA: UDP-N-acetylmuramoyl-tripeptide--D-alanyl-D-alanine ligase [Thermoanaerobaculia bacterium]|nr:UDP-N-acetylmuramoyl-tripeptide--D-alanyl-D-alanine ligase [Thermoanaerobaculia bacterium]